MSRSFANHWKDEELADVDVLLTVAGTQQQSGTDQHQQLETAPLVRFPAHRVLLCTSSFLRAQIVRWQRKRPAPTDNSSSPRLKLSVQPLDPDKLVSVQLLQFAATVPLPDQDRPQVVLTLQDASQQAAAMVCLEALYATKPLPELLAGLSQEQQLQAAVLADMWEVPDVSAAVVECLTTAVGSENKLSDTATQHLLQMPAHPECLQPLLKQVLLSRLGDLEAVWADAELQKLLLSLPLQVMEVLLSLDDLMVATEDTVLYTAQRYVDQLPADQRCTAASKLAKLIRCPHLSTYWLSASVLSAAAPRVVLHELESHIKPLVMMRITDRDFKPTADELQKLFRGTPDAWRLGQRKHKNVGNVHLTWAISVNELREAARRRARERDDPASVRITSSASTPPLGGLAWRLTLEFAWDSEKQGTKIGVYTSPTVPSRDMLYRFQFTLAINGARTGIDYIWSDVLGGDGNTMWGFPNAFNIAPMTDGWDEVKWAAKGLPTSGDVKIELTIIGVKHS